MIRPSRFHIMRVNRLARERTLRIERLIEEARAIGMDEPGDAYELCMDPTVAPALDRCCARITHPKPRPRWWQLPIILALLWRP